jgi:hypothetical protein
MGCSIGSTPNCVEPCALLTSGNSSVQNFARFSIDPHRLRPGTRDCPTTKQFLGVVNPNVPTVWDAATCRADSSAVSIAEAN